MTVQKIGGFVAQLNQEKEAIIYKMRTIVEEAVVAIFERYELHEESLIDEVESLYVEWGTPDGHGSILAWLSDEDGTAVGGFVVNEDAMLAEMQELATAVHLVDEFSEYSLSVWYNERE